MIINESLWGSIDRETQRVYVQVVSFIESFIQRTEAAKKESKSFNLTYRCHSLCKFVAAHVPTVECVDGVYLGLKVVGSVDGTGEILELTECDHSWLTSSDGTIFDPYPVGLITLNPVIIPWNEVYRHHAYQLYCKRSTVMTGETEALAIQETNGLLNFFPVPTSQPT